MRNWHLLYTKPRREPVVSQQLEDRGLDVFFPYLQFERGHGRGSRLEPFFPHYLFVKVDLTAAEATGLRHLVGVRTIVHLGDLPAVVPEEVVENLRERLDPYRGKVIRKSEWLFKAGQRVEVTDGPFAGYEAIFQSAQNGGQRVQILLDLVGSWARTQLSIDQIKPVSDHEFSPA